MSFARRLDRPADVFAALRDRRLQLDMTQEFVEHRVNLTHGHLGKIEAGDKSWGKKPISWTGTLNWLLELYGLKLCILTVEEANALMGPDRQARISRHRDKSTREPFPNQGELSITIRRRPRLLNDADTSGESSPDATPPAKPSDS